MPRLSKKLYPEFTDYHKTALDEKFSTILSRRWRSEHHYLVQLGRVAMATRKERGEDNMTATRAPKIIEYETQNTGWCRFQVETHRFEITDTGYGNCSGYMWFKHDFKSDTIMHADESERFINFITNHGMLLVNLTTELFDPLAYARLQTKNFRQWLLRGLVEKINTQILSSTNARLDKVYIDTGYTTVDGQYHDPEIVRLPLSGLDNTAAEYQRVHDVITELLRLLKPTLNVIKFRGKVGEKVIEVLRERNYEYSLTEMTTPNTKYVPTAREQMYLQGSIETILRRIEGYEALSTEQLSPYMGSSYGE